MRYLKNKVSRALEKKGSSPENILTPEALQRTLQKVFHNEKFIVKQDSHNQFILIKQETIIPIKQEPSVVTTTPTSTPTPVPKFASILKCDYKPIVRSPEPLKKDVQTNKNIVKNYARAMINFALSEMSHTYLNKIIAQEGIDHKEFKEFLLTQKEIINSIKTLRDALLIPEGDRSKLSAFKRAFKAISEVFIKFFAVNWIFNSKINDKTLHLKYRFKILRRIRNPEHFTYLENFNKTR